MITLFAFLLGALFAATTTFLYMWPYLCLERNKRDAYREELIEWADANPIS